MPAKRTLRTGTTPSVESCEISPDQNQFNEGVQEEEACNISSLNPLATPGMGDATERSDHRPTYFDAGVAIGRLEKSPRKDDVTMGVEIDDYTPPEDFSLDEQIEESKSMLAPFDSLGRSQGSVTLGRPDKQGPPRRRFRDDLAGCNEEGPGTGRRETRMTIFPTAQPKPSKQTTEKDLLKRTVPVKTLSIDSTQFALTGAEHRTQSDSKHDKASSIVTFTQAGASF